MGQNPHKVGVREFRQLIDNVEKLLRKELPKCVSQLDFERFRQKLIKAENRLVYTTCDTAKESDWYRRQLTIVEARNCIKKYPEFFDIDVLIVNQIENDEVTVYHVSCPSYPGRYWARTSEYNALADARAAIEYYNREGEWL